MDTIRLLAPRESDVAQIDAYPLAFENSVWVPGRERERYWIDLGGGQ